MGHFITPVKLTQTGSYAEREIYSVADSARVPFAGPDMIACCRVTGTPGLNVFPKTTPLIFQFDNCTVDDALVGGPALELNFHLEPLDYSPPPSTPASASILFGISCGSEIAFDMIGSMRAFADGLDWIEILVNGAQEYYKESSHTEGVAYYTGAPYFDPLIADNPHATYPYTESIVIPLSALPCGNIIEVRCGTGSVHATEAEVWAPPIAWTAKITAIN